MPAKKKPQPKKQKRKAGKARATNHASNKVTVRVMSGGGGAGGGGAGGMVSAPPMSYMQPQQFVPMHVNTPSPFQAVGRALNVPAQPVAAGRALPANAAAPAAQQQPARSVARTVSSLGSSGYNTPRTLPASVAAPAQQPALRVPLTVGPAVDDDAVSTLSSDSVASRISEQSHPLPNLLQELGRRRIWSPPHHLTGRGYNDETIAAESARRSQSLHDQINTPRHDQISISTPPLERLYQNNSPGSVFSGSPRALESVMRGAAIPRPQPRRVPISDETVRSAERYLQNFPAGFDYERTAAGKIDRRKTLYKDYVKQSARQQQRISEAELTRQGRLVLG